MPPKFSQIVYNVPVLKSLLPLLNNLPLPDAPKGLIPHLNGFQLVPKHISVWGNQISQPLKQNHIITANQET